MTSWIATDACTLPTTQQPLRVAEFDTLFRTDLAQVRREQTTRIVLALRDRPGLAELVTDLAEREAGCCSFFRFATGQVGDTLELAVEVPEERAGILEALADRAGQLAGVAR